MNLSMATKRQIIEQQRRAYEKATKKGKLEILEALALSTVLSKTHLSRVLRGKYQHQRKPFKEGRGRKQVYGPELKEPLVKI